METQYKDKKYIMAIDSGGAGIRALLFNKAGEIKYREYEKTPSVSTEPGAIEHDPEVLWNALLLVVDRLFKNNGISPDEIASIGITNQRGSFSRPLRPSHRGQHH